jgi:hypothetical protein
MKNACKAAALPAPGGKNWAGPMITSTESTICQIEFELEKAEHGMALPYDAERVISCAARWSRRASGSYRLG